MFHLIKTYKRKQKLKKTNFGRDCDWYIVNQNKRIAELTEVLQDDMFWDSYIVTIYENNEEFLTDINNWNNLKFENKCFNEFVEDVILSEEGSFLLKNSIRICVRGLYLK